MKYPKHPVIRIPNKLMYGGLMKLCSCGNLLAAFNTTHPTMKPEPGDLTTCRCGKVLIFELEERVLGGVVLRPRPLTETELLNLPAYLRAQLEVTAR